MPKPLMNVVSCKSLQACKEKNNDISFSTYANKFSHDPEKQEILANKHELFKQLGFLGHHMSQTAFKQLHHGGEYLFIVNDKR